MKKFINPDIELIDVIAENIVTTSVVESSSELYDPYGFMSQSAEDIYSRQD